MKKRLISILLLFALTCSFFPNVEAEIDSDNYSGQSTEFMLWYQSHLNPNCTSTNNHDDKGCPQHFCIDLGNGHCLPYWIEIDVSTGYGKSTKLGYLYEVELKDVVLTNDDGSPINTKQGQYFYMPVAPDGDNGVAYIDSEGQTRWCPNDIQNLQPLIDAGLEGAKKIGGNTENLMAIDGYSNYEAWSQYDFIVIEDGLKNGNFKYEYAPWSYFTGDYKETTENLPTAFIRYTGTNGRTYYLIPRMVWDSELSEVSFLTFCNDSRPTESASKLYSADIIQANPHLKNKYVRKGNVNKDWVASESGNSIVMSDLWNKALSTSEETGKKYLDPYNPNLTEHEKQMVQNLYSTVQIIKYAWGHGVISETLLFNDGTTAKKEYDPTIDRGIDAIISKYINGSAYSAYYPGEWKEGASQEYIRCYYTAIAKLFFTYFQITDYCGVGTQNYGKIMCSRPGWYNGHNIPKVATSKDLVMESGWSSIADDDFYNLRLWRPNNEEFEAQWIEMDEEAQNALVNAMSNTEFLEKFVIVDPTEDTVLPDYPYIVQSSVYLLTAQENANDYTLSNSYHYDIKADYGLLTLKEDYYYEDNQKALSGDVKDESTQALNRAGYLINGILANVGGYSVDELAFKTFPQAINNKVENTEGRFSMPTDRVIYELSKEVNNQAGTLLHGGRLYPYNFPVLSTSIVPEYETGTDNFNFGSTLPNGAIAPESDETHKMTNVNVYRAVLRTKTLEQMQSERKVDTETPLYVAVISRINPECNTYTEDYPDERSYHDALTEAAQLAVNYNLNDIMNTNDNINTANDDAVVIYRVAGFEPEKRNIQIINVDVYNSDNQRITRVSSRQDEINIKLDDMEELSKDYTVKITDLYQFESEIIEGQEVNTDSVNPDLTLSYTYNDEYTNSTITMTRDIPTHKDVWPTEQTGDFTFTTIPIKAITEMLIDAGKNEGKITLTVWIPEQYNENEDGTPNDNERHDDWEQVVINFILNIPPEPEKRNDNEILSCELFDNTGKSYGKYVREGDAWIAKGVQYLSSDPEMTYYAEITVRRNETNEENPILTLNSGSTEAWEPSSEAIRIKNYTEYMNTIVDAGPEENVQRYAVLKNGSSTKLEADGDIATYILNPSRILTYKMANGTTTTKTINGLLAIESMCIEINAFFQPTDDIRANNIGDGGWNNKPWIWTMPGLDYYCNDLKISPDIIYLDCNTTYDRSIQPTFSVVAGLTQEGINTSLSLDDANVSIWMFEKKPTDITYSENGGVKVYSTTVPLKRGGQSIVLTGQLGIGATKDNPGQPITFKAGCSYKFIAIINGGNGQPGRVPSERTFPKNNTAMGEINWWNNESFKEVSVDNQTLCEIGCENLCQNTSNTRGTNKRNDWNITFFFEEEPTEIWYEVPSCCDAEGGCSCTELVCRPADYHSWEVTKHFWEQTDISMYFRSQEEPDEWKLMTSENANEIRAGHWFEVKFVSTYETNRVIDTPTPNPYSHCNWLTRTPGVLSSDANRTVIIEMLNPTGGQARAWRYRISGPKVERVVQRFTVPENTQNLDITFKFGVAGFDGIITETNKQLCIDCMNMIVTVKNPNPIIGGNTEIV